MIQTVEKKYNLDNTVFYSNRHYQEILEWVAEGNTITDNGGGE
jgi:hypothetical protein